MTRRAFRGSVLALILGLFLSSILGYCATRHEIGEMFDAALIDNTRLFKGLIDVAEPSQNWPQLQQALNETLSEHIEHFDPRYNGHAYEKKLAIQVWSADGNLVLRSASAPPHALAPLRAGLVKFSGEDYDWLVNTVWLPKRQHWLVVAERSDIRQELIDNIEASLFVGLLLGLSLALWLLRRELRNAFKPLLALGKNIATRSLEDLTPLNLTATPKELRPVVDELNELFARVATSLERERRFLADAAHELRTPLSVIQLQVEQALRQPEQQQQILQKLLLSVGRNQQVIEQMLLLARLESGQMALQPQTIALDALLREAAAQLMPLALQRDIDIEVDAIAYTLQGDAALLLAMLRNLIDNALRHSPNASCVRCILSAESNTMSLSVIDSGVGIDPKLMGIVQGRFQQIGTADVGASGLGLAIVNAVAQLHAMQLSLHNHSQGGLEVKLSWDVA